MDQFPFLEFNPPNCSHCGNETVDVDDGFECDTCGLYWRHSDYNYNAPEYADHTAEPCGHEPTEAKEISRREDRKRFYLDYLSMEMTMRPCSLPEGHKSNHFYQTDLRKIHEEQK